MNAPKPPIKSLIDSFEYHEYVGINDWSEPLCAPGVTIKNVRIDRSVNYSVSNEKTILYNGVIFCYEGLTEPLLDFKKQSKVHFDGQDKTIVKVIVNKEPFKDTIYSIELEVV